MSKTGVSEDMVDGLEPETGYTTYVYAMDAVSGRATGTIFRGNFTTMASAVTADLSVKATNIRWFKGSDLAKLDPKYASIADDAYLLADVQTKGNPRTWYINLAVGDMTDPDAFPDETTIEALLMSTTPDKTELRMAVRHEDATFLGIAIDDYGQMGELYREKISITEEGASPIEDFPADELSMKALPMMPELGTASRNTNLPSKLVYSRPLGRIVAK